MRGHDRTELEDRRDGAVLEDRRDVDRGAAGDIYVGKVRHRRLRPRPHTFEYPLFQVYLDLGALDRAFPGSRLWSYRRPALAWLRRRDYLGDPELTLDDAVRRLVAEETGRRPEGRVFFLGHLRTWGHYFSPVSFYYCFAEDGEALQAIVAEVVNTPWGERRCYVLHEGVEEPAGGWLTFRLDKDFHVSPFMPMEVDYTWRFSRPGERLAVHMESFQEGEKLFDATLRLERRRPAGRALARVLVRHAPQNAKVLAWIYFQAFRLWLKGTPFFIHPAKRASGVGRGAAA